MSMRFGSGRVQGVGRAAHAFSMAPSANIPRSLFNRSHGIKTTFDEGYLVPILCDEALPGDTFHLKMNGFARILSPMDDPIMDNLYLETFFFAVPYRLVWTNWERFNGAQDDPADTTDYTIPVFTAATIASGDLHDYMGIPPDTANDISWNSLHARAYNLIYNEWFRDENLQDSVVVDKDDGPDADTDYVLLRRNKRYDYFTSCLPWPQKVNDGSTLNVPLSGSADVVTDSSIIKLNQSGSTEQNLTWKSSNDRLTGLNSAGVPWTNDVGVIFGSNTGLTADLSTASGVTINQLREAFQIQKLFERDARGGTRYTEVIRNHFGVISPDARLQRPEYLGGGSSYVHVHPVASTNGATGGTLAELGSFGTASVHGHGFSKSFTEHCLIIGLISSRADLNYQQGIERMYSRQTRYDFYWPSLSHIGEQAVLSKEIFADGSANDEDVFGYQERYGEYRYKPSQITGLFRSYVTGALDTYHLAQEFAARPTLNTTFIVENAPMTRILTNDDVPDFILDAMFDYKCARPMPVYGTPGLIDHF